MQFIMRRDRTVVSALGHAIEFKKGEPTHVPPALHREVLDAGAEPVDGDSEEIRADAPKPNSNEPTEPAEREKQILEAMELLATENKRENFTAAGLPHAKALASVLGWSPADKERDILWAKFIVDKGAD